MRLRLFVRVSGVGDFTRSWFEEGSIDASQVVDLAVLSREAQCHRAEVAATPEEDSTFTP